MTTMKISEDNWLKLNKMKMPGETFDNVIRGLLDREERHDGKRNKD